MDCESITDAVARGGDLLWGNLFFFSKTLGRNLGAWDWKGAGGSSAIMAHGGPPGSIKPSTRESLIMTQVHE
jgi:hypothetical protein